MAKLKFTEKNYVSLREAKSDEKGRKVFGVCIIRQGLGNLRDKNYYSAEAIQGAAAIYEGKKAYYDHPTESQEREQPNRSVKEIAAHYENVKPQKAADGLWELVGDLVPVSGDSRKDCVELLTHAVEYSKKYPDKNFVGISINGSGAGVAMDYEEFLKTVKPSKEELAKIKEIEGQDINVITQLTDAISADIVTEPGAGGGVRSLKESNFKKRRDKMFKFMKQLFEGVANGDQKQIEAAVKGLKEDEGQGKGVVDMEAEAGAMAKHYMAAKKELKKEDGESEAEYEAKCMKQAMGALKKEADEAKAKAEDEGQGKAVKDMEDKDEKKEDGKDDADADDKDKKDDKKEAGDEKPADDEHADKDQDMALIKKMMKQMGEKIEQLEKKSKQNEDEAKSAHESAAKAQTELAIKARESMIETKLAKCGLRREITSNWKPVLNKCKTEKEIDEVITKMTETAHKVLSEAFAIESVSGIVERQANDHTKSNDDLFK